MTQKNLMSDIQNLRTNLKCKIKFSEDSQIDIQF